MQEAGIDYQREKPAFAGFSQYLSPKNDDQIKLAESGGFEPPIELEIL
jgi:hypothetical protein